MTVLPVGVAPRRRATATAVAAAAPLSPPPAPPYPATGLSLLPGALAAMDVGGRVQGDSLAPYGRHHGNKIRQNAARQSRREATCVADGSTTGALQRWILCFSQKLDLGASASVAKSLFHWLRGRFMTLKRMLRIQFL